MNGRDVEIQNFEPREKNVPPNLLFGLLRNKIKTYIADTYRGYSFCFINPRKERRLNAEKIKKAEDLYGKEGKERTLTPNAQV